MSKRTKKLRNGTKVKLGDRLSFVNSDGNLCTDYIRLRLNGSLFFWNSSFNISDYASAFITNK